jgi:hypothetical protein
MRTLVVDPDAPEAVRLPEIAEPVPGGDDDLVECGTPG